ncbi:hypothetical protein BJ878DRAFT_524294 [Calycina marina]|uniref:Uncharacterized protein n=1 Tax=Calycina marina TaxID=1763456 RepID=A0A9P7YVJ4_9HELO|nr:hypothetical protein BJ878DRAFT_524294 [Calycina marina]
MLFRRYWNFSLLVVNFLRSSGSRVCGRVCFFWIFWIDVIGSDSLFVLSSAECGNTPTKISVASSVTVKVLLQ